MVGTGTTTAVTNIENGIEKGLKSGEISTEGHLIRILVEKVGVIVNLPYLGELGMNVFPFHAPDLHRLS